MAAIKTSTLLLGGIVIVGLLAFTGVIKIPGISPGTSITGAALPGVSFPGVTQPGQAPLPVIAGCGFASATLRISPLDRLSGATPSVNAVMLSDDGATQVAVANPNAKGFSFSTTAPTKFSGYVIMLNDEYATNFAGYTDRGTEYYAKKVAVKYGDPLCVGSYTIPDIDGGDIKIVQEGTPTWSGFDNGQLESPLNVSVGSGSTVDTSELQFTVGSNACIGNPEFDDQAPLAVAFNVSSGSLGVWDEVKPLNNVGTVAAPTNLTAQASVVNGVAYILPTKAICDNYPGHNAVYKFGFRLKAAAGQNPVNGDFLHATLWDKTWYLNDAGVWAAGYEKPRTLTTASDVGMSGVANLVTIGTT